MPRALSDEQYTAFRDKLCTVATRLFVEKGVGAVTMRELAAALGVSAMTPYRYFRNKREILAVVRANALTELAGALEAAAKTGDTVQARATAICREYVRFALDNPGRYRMLFEMPAPELPPATDAEENPQLYAAEQRCRHWIAETAEAMIADTFPARDVRTVSYAFWAILHGAVSLQLAGKFEAGIDFPTVVAAAFESLLKGFA